MRLIDADKIIEQFDQNTWQGEMMIAIANGLPTALDVDGVVKQIEERKADNIRISKLQGNSHVKKVSHICRSDEDEYILRLVKGAVKI